MIVLKILQHGGCSIFKEETIMAMYVQHNITAMNSNRQLGITTGAQAKSSEKLSSGYRINRAGDDAAGLKISEKMRSQVRGLTRASTNAQDGVSLIQTAEGALNEAHSILQRMNELAVQGANDTNENIDREAINQELDQLTQELDRISTTTQFNKQNLLDGSFQSKNLHVGANPNQKIEISIDNMNAATLGLRSIHVSDATSAIITSFKPDVQKGVSANKIIYKDGTSAAYLATSSATYNKKVALCAVKAALSTKSASTQYKMQIDKNSMSTYYIDGANNKYATANSARKADLSTAKVEASVDIFNNYGKYLAADAVSAASATVLNPKISVTPAKGNYDINKPQVDDYETANATLKAVQEAINKVSNQRSALGAIQNRLEHTIANLDNVAENTQAAESRIRDLDMASEMVEYSKNNILAQAGQSMLAQANQSTQGVLSLLG